MGPEKYDKWTKITVEVFLGFSILMGINHLPSLDDYYWSKDHLSIICPQSSLRFISLTMTSQ